MQIKTKSGLLIQKPSKTEDALINAGIAADPDAFELSDEWFDKAKPAKDFFPPETFNALVALKKNRGRPKVADPKVFTAIRLDADLVDAFKSTGKGWQTRINAALRQFIQEHPLAP
jgi:uncharacterized protein (DUF4415 family)